MKIYPLPFPTFPPEIVIPEGYYYWIRKDKSWDIGFVSLSDTGITTINVCGVHNRVEDIEGYLDGPITIYP